MLFTRPSLQDQDQDQDRIRLVWDRSCNKTKVSDHITANFTYSSPLASGTRSVAADKKCHPENIKWRHLKCKIPKFSGEATDPFPNPNSAGKETLSPDKGNTPSPYHTPLESFSVEPSAPRTCVVGISQALNCQFTPTFGRFGNASPTVLIPKMHLLVRKHVIWAINRENRFNGNDLCAWLWKKDWSGESRKCHKSGYISPIWGQAPLNPSEPNFAWVLMSLTQLRVQMYISTRKRLIPASLSVSAVCAFSVSVCGAAKKTTHRKWM